MAMIEGVIPGEEDIVPV